MGGGGGCLRGDRSVGERVTGDRLVGERTLGGREVGDRVEGRRVRLTPGRGSPWRLLARVRARSAVVRARRGFVVLACGVLLVACAPREGDRLGTECASPAWDRYDLADAVWVHPLGLGEGSLASPYASIAEALDAGHLSVAVGDGTFAESLSLGPEHAGLLLVGSCPEQVTLEIEGGSAGVDVALGEGSATVAGLSVVGAGAGGVHVSSGRVDLTDLEVRDATGAGIHIEGSGAVVHLERVAVRGGQHPEEAGVGGGIRIADGAQATGVDLEVVDALSWGLIVRGGAAGADLSDLRVSGTRHAEQGLVPGVGVQVVETGSLTLHGSTLSGSEGTGIYVAGVSNVSLDDVWVVDTGTAANNSSAGAIVLGDSGHLEMTGGGVDGAYTAGVNLGDAGSSAWLTDVGVRDVRVDSSGWTGFGVRVDGFEISSESQRPHLMLTNVLIESTDNTGLSVARPPRPRVEVAGLEVTDAGRAGTSASGNGVVVGGGEFTGADLWLHDNSLHGFVVQGAETEVQLVDSEIEGNLPVPWGASAGVFAYLGAVVDLTDVRISRNTPLGVLALTGSHVTLVRGEIDGQQASRSTAFGRGLHAELDGAIDAQGTHIHGNEGPGVVASASGWLQCADCLIEDNQGAGALNLGGFLSLERSEVRGTTAHPTGGGGYGVASRARGSVVELLVLDTEISGSSAAGIMLHQPFVGETTMAVQIVGSTVGGAPADAAPPEQSFRGDAVLVCGGVPAWDGTEGLWIAESTLRDAGRVGLLLHESSAALGEGVVFENNAIDAAQQPCEAVDDSLDGVPGAVTCTGYDFVTDCAEFDFVDAVPPGDR